MTTRILVTLLLLAAPALAQSGPPKIEAAKLTNRLTVIYGAGGNIAVGSGDTTFLVDDGLQPLNAAVKAEIAKVSAKPVRFVINTHWHGDHTGGNLMEGEAGAVI